MSKKRIYHKPLFYIVLFFLIVGGITFVFSFMDTQEQLRLIQVENQKGLASIADVPFVMGTKENIHKAVVKKGGFPVKDFNWPDNAKHADDYAAYYIPHNIYGANMLILEYEEGRVLCATYVFGMEKSKKNVQKQLSKLYPDPDPTLSHQVVNSPEVHERYSWDAKDGVEVRLSKQDRALGVNFSQKFKANFLLELRQKNLIIFRKSE